MHPFSHILIYINANTCLNTANTRYLNWSLEAHALSTTATGTHATLTSVDCTNTLPSGSQYGSNTSLTLPWGSTYVSCFATDSNGLTSAPCAFIAFVVDRQPPNLICPASSVLGNDINQNYLLLSQPSLIVSDNADDISSINHSCILPSTRLYCNTDGTVHYDNITCYAIDSSGNVATCTYKVGVRDEQPPAFTSNLNRYIHAYIHTYIYIYEENNLMIILCNNDCLIYQKLVLWRAFLLRLFPLEPYK